MRLKLNWVKKTIAYFWIEEDTNLGVVGTAERSVVVIEQAFIIRATLWAGGIFKPHSAIQKILGGFNKSFFELYVS